MTTVNKCNQLSVAANTPLLYSMNTLNTNTNVIPDTLPCKCQNGTFTISITPAEWRLIDPATAAAAAIFALIDTEKINWTH